MSKAKKAIKRLTISLSEESFKQLEEISYAQDRSLSWLVAQAVGAYIQREGKKVETKKR